MQSTRMLQLVQVKQRGTHLLYVLLGKSYMRKQQGTCGVQISSYKKPQRRYFFLFLWTNKAITMMNTQIQMVNPLCAWLILVNIYIAQKSDHIDIYQNLFNYPLIYYISSTLLTSIDRLLVIMQRRVCSAFSLRTRCLFMIPIGVTFL